MRGRRPWAWAAACAALALAVGGTALPASAADGDPVITFQQPAQELEYGQGWNFYATATNTYQAIGPWKATATVTGITPSVFYSYNQDGTYTTYITILNAQGVRPLPVGEYAVTATVTNAAAESWSSAPGSLIVVPAKLAIEVRLTADPSAPGNAILTARFTGRFVDDFSAAEYPTSALAPAGVWQLVIKDAKGETVLDETVERAEGGNDLATSVYWTGAAPGDVYTATATFTATGSGADNFSVTPGEGIPFTASTVERPVPTSTATAGPAIPLPEPEEGGAGVPLPLWALAGGGVVLAGLVALVVVLLVRIRGRSRAAIADSPTTVAEVEA